MKRLLKNGQTSVILRFFLQDSASTAGAGKTGLGIASAGLIISTIASNEATPTVYTAAGSTIETITTLGTFAAPTATKCRFKEVDSTNHPGLYEVQLADARFAVSSARTLLISIIATGIAPVYAECELVAVDLLDAVRLGLTALPNAVAGANGGLPLGDASGRVDIGKLLGTAWLTPGVAGTPDVNAKQAGGTAWGSGAITAGSIAADAITDAKVASDVTIASVTGAVGSVTGNVGGNVVGSVGSAPDSSGVTTLLGKLTGITLLKEWLGLLAGKQTGNSTARTEVRATGAGSGTFDETTDSQEALRDRGDAAWVTASGFSTLDAAGVRTAVGLASASLDTQLGQKPTASDIEQQIFKKQMDATYIGEQTTSFRNTLNNLVSVFSGMTSLAQWLGLLGGKQTGNSTARTELRATGAGSGTFDETTDSQEAIKDGGVASVAGAVGSVTGNVGGNLVGSIGSLATQAKAEVNAEADTALSDYDAPTKAELDAAQAAIIAAVPTAAINAAGLLDLAAGVETGLTPRQALRLIVAALGGLCDGAATTTMHFRNQADTKNRITATVDASGNRTAITTDLT